jgi:hypothetical protein
MWSLGKPMPYAGLNSSWQNESPKQVSPSLSAFSSGNCLLPQVDGPLGPVAWGRPLCPHQRQWALGENWLHKVRKYLISRAFVV